MNPDRGYRKSNVPEGAKRVFEGKIFDVYQWEQKLYDGSFATFEKIVRPDTVSVIPILPDNTILLIEDSQPHRDMVLTVPTGKVDPGEAPEETARRELMEETGYTVDALELISERSVTEKIDWVVYTFIGRNARKAKDAHPEAGEKITPRIVSFDEFIALASDPNQRTLRADTAAMAVAAKNDPVKMAELKKLFFG